MSILYRPAGQKCPWCGEGLNRHYEKCSHCASPISWVSNVAIKPGTCLPTQCARGHGALRIWNGEMRCWTCGYPDT